MHSDNEIIELVLQGKKDHFTTLMDKYHNELFAYVFNITGNYHSTEDLIQGIFIRIYEQLKKYDSKRASFRTWIYRIALNQTLNYLNSKSYRNTYQTVELIEDTLKVDAGIESDIIKSERITQIVNAIQKTLKPKHQQIMHLHYFTGLTIKEISMTLNIPDKTIYKSINSSIEKIKKEVVLDD